MYPSTILLKSALLNDLNSQLKNILILKNNEINRLSKIISVKMSASNLEEDISFLVNNEWISDSILNACLKNMAPICDDVLSFDSNVSFLIKLLNNDDLNEFLSPLDLSKYNILTFFVSDCGKYQSPNPEAVNGSHWSLLALDLNDSIGYHFDSSNTNINDKHARKILNNLSMFLKVEFWFVEAGTYFQRNNFNSGIETLGNLQQISHHLRLGFSMKTLALVKNDTDVVRKKVKDFLIILKYGKNKQDYRVFD